MTIFNTQFDTKSITASSHVTPEQFTAFQSTLVKMMNLISNETYSGAPESYPKATNYLEQWLAVRIFEWKRGQIPTLALQEILQATSDVAHLMVDNRLASGTITHTIPAGLVMRHPWEHHATLAYNDLVTSLFLGKMETGAKLDKLFKFSRTRTDDRKVIYEVSWQSPTGKPFIPFHTEIFELEARLISAELTKHGHECTLNITYTGEPAQAAA